MWQDTSNAKRYISKQVLAYFQPLLEFLEYKGTFDAAAEVQRKVVTRVCGCFASSAYLDGIVTMLHSNPVIALGAGEYTRIFNANPYVLPCANGMLDFRTLELRPIVREDYVTYKTETKWDAAADTSGPRAFLQSLFPYNTAEMVAFIEMWLGYCLTGLTQQQIVVFMIGYGSNGKSKLANVMVRNVVCLCFVRASARAEGHGRGAEQENLLGPVGYAKVPYESLCQKGTSPNEDVYAARNARMWQVDENDGNEFLNLSMIKRWTYIDVFLQYGHD